MKHITNDEMKNADQIKKKIVELGNSLKSVEWSFDVIGLNLLG
jgi:hypothetical protein